jgi:glyoxylate reductase
MGRDMIRLTWTRALNTVCPPANPKTHKALTPAGITLSNTPGAVNTATATTALYLLISTLRQFSPSERSLRAGHFKPSGIASRSHEPSTRVLGILGLGGIGKEFAGYADALGMKVVYHSRREKAGEKWTWYKDPEEMLSVVDVLSVHVPLGKETEGLVGERWIRRMKRGSIIINTARGKVIDEDAVIRALEDGHVRPSFSPSSPLYSLISASKKKLSSVGLDVYPNEPEVNPRLLSFPQCTLLPHMGTENQDAQRGMEVRALRNLVDFLTVGRGGDVVPEMR